MRALAALLLVLAPACKTLQSPLMELVDPGPSPEQRRPSPGRSLVFFLKCGRAASTYAPLIWEEGDKPIGVMFNGSFVTWETDPGPRRFMLHLKSTEFLEAQLLPDKTYFVAIGTHLKGFWFIPLSPQHAKWGEQLRALTSGCREGKRTREVDAWIEEERFRTGLFWSRFPAWKSRHPDRFPLTADMGI